MKKIGRFLTVLVLAAALLCSQGLCALAAGPVTAQIPVSITLTGLKPSPGETYTVQIAATDPSYPLPAGAVDGTATLEITGEGSASFQIAYTSPGVYTYKVSQVAGSNSNCSYDSCIYEVTVTVTNSETVPGGLDAVVYAVKEHVPGTKCPIEFTNRYPIPIGGGSLSPSTGDETDLPMSYAMVAGGILVLLVLFFTRKKKETWGAGEG